MTTDTGDSAWCPKCHRLKDVGCACDLTFGEKVKTLRIDKKSLTTDDQQWRDYDSITGQDEKRREWGRSKLKSSSTQKS